MYDKNNDSMKLNAKSDILVRKTESFQLWK